MANYKSMYYKLFVEMSDPIDRFKETLLEVEKLFVETELKEYHKDETEKSY